MESTIDLKSRFDEIIGVTLKQENDVEDIYFAVDSKSLDYIRTKWLHTTQIEFDEQTQFELRKKYPALEHMTFFSIACRENQELYAKFASYIPNIVVVEPLSIRNKVYDNLKVAIACYDQLNR